jgi:predicted amino acid dehydrogenase
MLTGCPAYMVSKVEWRGVVQGLVISTSIMPEDLFLKREDTSSQLSRIVSFIKKITDGKVYVGLAAWWPIVTNSGLAFKRVVNEDDRIVVTNGHTATLLSIYLIIDKICEIAGLKFSELNILIIGVGKMGSAVAELLNGKVNDIGIIDRNAIRMKTLEKNLLKKTSHSTIKRYEATDSFLSEKLTFILSKYDIAVCTTSNVNYLIKDPSLLRDCIIIDDSRPEAFPRIIDLERNVLVLEGGLIKFKGLELDSDFGFGKKDNVFGCMAEAILLALDNMQTLKPTLGDIDYDNFNKMLIYCKKNNITEGDLKSGQKEVTFELLRRIIKNKYTYSEKNR